MGPCLLLPACCGVVRLGPQSHRGCGQLLRSESPDSVCLRALTVFACADCLLTRLPSDLCLTASTAPQPRPTTLFLTRALCLRALHLV